MDTISPNETKEAGSKTSKTSTSSKAEGVSPAPITQRSPFTPQKITATAVILFLLAAIQIGPLRSLIFENSLFQAADNVAEECIDKSFKRAMIAYATARGLNAVISVIQESDLHIQPAGIGVTIAVGEALDPVNDMIERFSWIMLASLLSLGIQKSLVIIAPWLSITVLLNISLICMLPALWMQNSFSYRSKEIAKKTLFAAILLKIAMPCVAYLNHQVYVTILEQKYMSASAMIKQEADSLREVEVEAVTEGETTESEDAGWISKAKNSLKKAATYNLIGLTVTGVNNADVIKQKIAELKAKTGEMTENFIRMSIVFLLNTIVIPICFLWGLIKLGQLLIGNSFGAGLEQTFRSKIAGGKSPGQPDLEAAATN